MGGIKKITIRSGLVLALSIKALPTDEELFVGRKVVATFATSAYEMEFCVSGKDVLPNGLIIYHLQAKDVDAFPLNPMANHMGLIRARHKCQPIKSETDPAVPKRKLRK